MQKKCAKKATNTKSKCVLSTATSFSGGSTIFSRGRGADFQKIFEIFDDLFLKSTQLTFWGLPNFLKKQTKNGVFKHFLENLIKKFRFLGWYWSLSLPILVLYSELRLSKCQMRTIHTNISIYLYQYLSMVFFVFDIYINLYQCFFFAFQYF